MPAFESALARNNRFDFSSFGGVAFSDGFYQHEIAHSERWCSAHGEITIWLGAGDWTLTFFLRIDNVSSAPDVFIHGKQIKCEHVRHDDRIAVAVALRGMSEYATLQFNSKSTFVPAEIDKSLESHRRLGFWLLDEFWITRETYA